VEVEEALAILDRALQPNGLTNVQELVFRRAWQGQTYSEIAQSYGYDADYVKDVGSKLWQLLSDTFGEKVTKSNFQSVLRRRVSTALQTRALELQEGLEGTFQPSPNQVISAQLQKATEGTFNKYQDWGEAFDASIFYGRALEMAILEQWIISDRCRLVSIFGMGGIGKTALTVKLAENIQGEFDFLIWRSLRNAPSIAELLDDWLRLLSNQQTGLPQALDGKMSLLLEYLRQRRCLLVLDNFESVLRGCNASEASQSDRAGYYQAGYEGYGQLIRRVSEATHQSCLILTSREKPVGLSAKEGKALPVRSFQLAGLDSTAGQQILKAIGLTSPAQESRALIDCYAGNPLALRIVSTAIQDLFDGNIARFLEQGTLVFGDIRDLLNQQFNRLSRLEKQVISCLVTNPEWHSLLALPGGNGTPVSQWELLEALESLKRRSLIETNLVHLTQQPVIVEYMNKQLIEQAQAPACKLANTSPIQGQTPAEDYIQETQADFVNQLITDQLISASQRKWQ